MNNDNSGSDPADVSPPAQRWTLVAMILGSGVAFLNSSVVNVALPAIDRSLGAGLSGLQWIVDGYGLTLAALMIPGGSLGDRYGRRRIMLTGLIGFGVTSILCGLSPSVGWLVVARMLQGLSGALLVPGSLAILRAVYTDREKRGQAIGQWSGWSGITTIIGPLLGGWLVDTLSWRWAFFINLPLIIVTAWLMVRWVPESRNPEASERLDWISTALIIVALGGISYGLIQGPVSGWGSPAVLIALIAGGVALLIFPVVENAMREPLVPLGLFRRRNFSGANLTTLGVYFALHGMFFFLVIFIQNVLGYSALVAGLMLAPISLLLLVLSPVFGRLAGQYGPRLFMSVGPLVFGGGLLLLTRLGPDSGLWMGLLPALVTMGLGMAATVAPLTDTVMSSVPDRRSGIAAAFNNVVARVSGLLAVAGLGVVLSFSFNAALEERTADLALAPSEAEALEATREDPTGAADVAGLPPEAEVAVEESYTVAFHRVMVTAALVALAGGGIAAVTIRNPSGWGSAGRSDDREEME